MQTPGGVGYTPSYPSDSLESQAPARTIILGSVLSYYGLSDTGCVRQNNEDAFLIEPQLGLYALADGMGGAQAGEVASRIAVHSLCSYLAEHPGDSLENLVRAVEYANDQILVFAADPKYKGMGTTLVCAMESQNGLQIANVGDSRAWLLTGGSLELLTSDQTWVNEVGRPLGLTEENIRSHPMRHVLTMALGVGNSLRVQAFPLELHPGSLLLLSSDGLHGPVSEEEICEILLRPISLEARAHLLIEAARQAGGPDNITVVLLQN